MCVDLHINEPFSVEKKLSASAKYIDPGQPVQSVQADLGPKNFVKSISCMSPYYLIIYDK